MPTPSSPRCVIVDDNPSILTILSNFCEQYNFQVRLATTDPKQAFDYIISNHPVIDLLLTDLEMPKLTGEQLITELSSKIPVHQIVIIIVSGNVSQPPLLPIEKVHLIHKPITRKKWEACLKEVSIL